MLPEPEEPFLSEDVIGATAVGGSVLVYNCTSSEVSSLRVNYSDNGMEFAPNGIPAIGDSGSPPDTFSYVSVPLCYPGVTPPSCRGFYTGPSGSSVSIAFNGVAGWAQNIIVPQVYINSVVYLWCFSNGFVISDGQGRLRQLYVQVPSSALAPVLEEPVLGEPAPESDGGLTVHVTDEAITVVL